MEMALASLHHQYPGRYVTAVRTNHDELFDNHPLVSKIEGDEGVINVMMHYDMINLSHIPFHFGYAYCCTLSDKLGIPLRLHATRPSLYLSADEWANCVLEQKTGLKGPYCVINAGYKSDCEVKWAGRELYQSVVDEHGDAITFVQIGAESDHWHHHTKLNGVVDLVGKTTLRELVRLVAGASFGIGGITAIGHMFAAFALPYVCMIGGREPLSWIGYNTQISLNTHGLLPCCKTGGCWKSKMSDPVKEKNCLLPVIDSHGCTIPTCHAMLKKQAIDAVGVLVDGYRVDEDERGDELHDDEASATNDEAETVTLLKKSNLLKVAKLAGFQT